MKNSVIKQYMEQKDLNQNQIAAAAGLVRNSIRRQVESDFDGVTMRTVKLLANVLGVEPSEVFNDLYAFAGGINDYSDNAGLYGTLHYTVDGTTLTPEPHPSGDTYNLHAAIAEIKQIAEQGVGEDERVDVAGGIGEDNIITISIDSAGVHYSFEYGTNDDFKAMWQEILQSNFPKAQEW